MTTITVDSRKLAELINRLQVWTEIRHTDKTRAGILIAQSTLLETEADLLDLGVQLPGGSTAEQLRTRAAQLAEYSRESTEAAA
jgi:hypothetical protein